MERRDFLKALAGLGGLLVARPSLAGTLGGLGAATGAARRSKLPSSSGLMLVSTDLHNHSLISGDALGDPHTALQTIHARGIDVACMTEHAISGKGHGELTCPGWEEGGCHKVEGINDPDWAAMADFADAAYAPGEFVSFRGFEYSGATLGHLNVWFSSKFTDPLHQNAFITPQAMSELDQLIPQTQPIADLFEAAPDTASIRPFYNWLAASPDTRLTEGGSDGVACFNHPNDFGDFEKWTYHAGAAARVTMFEAFNTNGYDEPDFFWYSERGRPNAMNACLNAGWRVGFTGVSDEHSTEYRQPGAARGGLWVPALT
ncbi:MAG: twin-arginine translocation signal domain-containing protein, partial [Actinomycetota bacterium]